MPRKLLREPLLHFLLLGMLLFLLYEVVSGWRGGADRRVVITDTTVAGLVQDFERTWQRPPTPQEIKGLVDERIREEILYREGAAMGLDRDDLVIRRRVLQKLDVISEESAEEAPTHAALQDWLQRHASQYAQPAVLDFDQVLFDPVRRGARLPSDLATALALLRAGVNPAKFGDPGLLPGHVASSPMDSVTREFGDLFAHALLGLPVGKWQGPVKSGYGAHLVRVNHVVPGRPSTLDEVRSSVERDFESDRRARARADYYRRLRQGYTVVIEARLPPDARPGANP